MDKNSANGNVPNVIIWRQSVWEIWRSLVWSVVCFTLARRETEAGPRLAGLLAASPPEAPPRAGLRAGPAGRAAPGELWPLRKAWAVRNHEHTIENTCLTCNHCTSQELPHPSYCRAICDIYYKIQGGISKKDLLHFVLYHVPLLNVKLVGLYSREILWISTQEKIMESHEWFSV